ncbi:hypothetical protein Holit_00679 [Hollandina sp. SP2]
MGIVHPLDWRSPRRVEPPVAGYDTEDRAFTEAGLGNIKIMDIVIPGGWVTELHHRGQGEAFCITIPYVLEASLTIETNGTCTFEYKHIYESDNTNFTG